MENREKLAEAGYEGAIVFDRPDYDNAIIGVTEDGRVVYDFNKMVDYLMVVDGMKRHEAVEFIEYNTIRALPYAGEKAPIIMFALKNL